MPDPTTDQPIKPSCATCRHYGKRRAGPACEGPPDDYAQATADDDSGLRSWFSPPPTFSCSHWMPTAKRTTPTAEAP